MKVIFMVPIPFPTPPPEGPGELASRRIMYVYKQCSIVDRNDLLYIVVRINLLGILNFLIHAFSVVLLWYFSIIANKKKFKEIFF